MKTTAVSLNITAWLALTLIVAILGSLVLWPPSFTSGYSHRTQGFIVGLFPRIEYAYVVEGAAYSGATDAIRPGDLRYGAPVTVLYDPQKPSASDLTTPWFSSANSLSGFILACAVIPLLLMILLHRAEVLPPIQFFRSFSSEDDDSVPSNHESKRAQALLAFGHESGRK